MAQAGYRVDELTDVEDLVFSHLQNDKKLYDWIHNLAHEPLAEIERIMGNIIRCHVKKHLPEHMKNMWINGPRVFAHMMHSADRLDDVLSEVFDLYVDCSSETMDTEKIDIHIGDTVQHKNIGMENIYATVIGEDVHNNQKWAVSYKTNQNKMTQGFWLKDRCKFISRPSTKRLLDAESFGEANEISKAKELGEEIVINLRNATDSFEKVNEQLTPVTYKLKPEQTMKANIRHETYINDHNIDEMTASDMIHAIKAAEEAIEKLGKMKVKTAYARQEVSRLKAFVTETAALLDQKFAEPETKKKK